MRSPMVFITIFHQHFGVNIFWGSLFPGKKWPIQVSYATTSLKQSTPQISLYGEKIHIPYQQESFLWYCKSKYPLGTASIDIYMLYVYLYPEDPWGWYISLHEWFILMVHVGKYTIHASFGICIFQPFIPLFRISHHLRLLQHYATCTSVTVLIIGDLLVRVPQNHEVKVCICSMSQAFGEVEVGSHIFSKLFTARKPWSATAKSSCSKTL